MHVLVNQSPAATLCGLEGPSAVVASFQAELADFQRDKVRCPVCLLRLDSHRLIVTARA